MPSASSIIIVRRVFTSTLNSSNSSRNSSTFAISDTAHPIPRNHFPSNQAISVAYKQERRGPVLEATYFSSITGRG